MLLVIKLVFESAELASNKARQGTTHNRDGKGHTKGSDLHPGLGSQGNTRTVSLNIGESLFNCIFIVKLAGRISSGDGTENASHHAGNSVEVIHTAGVVKLELFLKNTVEFHDSKGRNDARNSADDDGKSAAHAKVGRSSDSNTTSEGSVEHNVHFEFTVEDGRDEAGGES